MAEQRCKSGPPGRTPERLACGADADFIFHSLQRSEATYCPLPVPTRRPSNGQTPRLPEYPAEGQQDIFFKQDHLGSETEPVSLSPTPPPHSSPGEGAPRGKQRAQQGSDQESSSTAAKPWPDTISFKKKKKTVQGLWGAHN